MTPAADTTYVLTASNQYGSAVARVSVAVFAPPKTWFAPWWNLTDPNYGSVDFMSLFAPDAAWATAASYIDVFKLYTFELDLGSDAELKQLFADLKRRHIALALEWGPLLADPNGSCGGGEGFTAEGTHYAQRIQSLGGSLQYIAFDEPFEFGGLASGPGTCQWTPEQVAQNAAAQTALIRNVFPDVVVGDIEVVPAASLAPDWLDRYQTWFDAWKEATGTAFAFFHFDVDWDADWKPAVAALSRVLRSRHIPVGQIYIGSFGVASDAQWIAAAEAHLTDYEIRGSPMPDEVIFQSWEPYPKHLVPESDPTTFTSLIDRYFRERTTLTLTANAGAGSGQLGAASGPVAAATVALTALPFSGTGQASSYVESGVVPAGAQYIVFGARVATECSWPLPAEFYLTDFTMDAGAAGRLQRDFASQLDGWGLWGNASLAQVENANLHIVVNPGESLGLNSASLPFSASGARYTFTVHGSIPVNSSGNGCVILVFQDQSFNELTRASIPVRPQPLALGTAQTASDGAFGLGFAGPLPGAFRLWADYSGSETLWPAAASVTIGAEPLHPVTTSLPPGRVGVAYAQTFSASGGLAPYVWVGSGWPPGLTLHSDGRITGTPATAGTYPVSVSVIDDSAPTQVKDLGLTVTVN